MLFWSFLALFGPSLKVARILLSLVFLTTPSEDPTQLMFCSGFIVDAVQGYALTARHCVTDLTAPLHANQQPAQVLRMDEQFALVSVKKGQPALKLAKGLPNPGDPVVSFGYGWGVHPLVLSRRIAWTSGGDLLTDGPLAPGMSGGPIVDTSGQVVGLNQRSNEIVGIACGVEEIRAFLHPTP